MTGCQSCEMPWDWRFEVAPALFSRGFVFSRGFGNPKRQPGEERTPVFPCLRGGFPKDRNFKRLAMGAEPPARVAFPPAAPSGRMTQTLATTRSQFIMQTTSPFLSRFLSRFLPRHSRRNTPRPFRIGRSVLLASILASPFTGFLFNHPMTNSSNAHPEEIPADNTDAKATTARPGKLSVYRLVNANKMEVTVTNRGATIMSIVVPDREGTMADVALGFNSPQDYIDQPNNPFFGAVAGRYANRIAGGSFTIDGTTYRLATNNGPNHLHGGKVGFDKVLWQGKEIRGDGFTGVQLTYHSKDGEEGYPGNLNVTIEYRLTDQNEIVVDYTATTDKTTHCNLTQHTYFNLKGEGQGDILDHQLMIHADQFTPVDPTLIPTGALEDVDGTPFDFRVAKPIGKDIDADDEQIERGSGFDHNWVLKPSDGKTLRLAARVTEATSGRVLEVRTTEPGLQLYCGNHLQGDIPNKSGDAQYVRRGGFCLETQHYPDSPNHPAFPTTLLKPGQTYHSTTVFAFSTL